ncbi:MAG: hypothetical protein WCY29_08050 [Novosphingobium sp.]
MKVLVIGGTGPSGPYLLRGLLDRGHDVTILHRGVHEPDDLPPVRHIHADPHFEATLGPAIGLATYDVVFALYARLEVTARVLAGRCGRIIGVGGRPIYAGYLDPASVFPRGMRVLADEDSPLADPDRGTDPRTAGFVARMRAAEAALFQSHPSATLFRYPYVYGRRALGTLEWSAIKRIRDGHRAINLPQGGVAVSTRCAAENAAHHLLLALDRERASAGEVFNCADDRQYSLAQWVELIAAEMGARLRVVDVPDALRWTVSHFLVLAGSVSDTGLIDNAKAKRVLGYRDVVAPEAALADAVRWYVANPVDWQRDPNYPDRFDYALEARVRAALDRLEREFSGENPHQLPVHSYAHPKAASLGTDDKGR